MEIGKLIDKEEFQWQEQLGQQLLIMDLGRITIL